MKHSLPVWKFRTVFCIFFFRDKMFPVLGFGARLPDGTVSHEFPCVSLVVMYFYWDFFY